MPMTMMTMMMMMIMRMDDDDDDDDDDTLLSFSVATAGETTGLPKNGEVCTNSNQAGDADDWYWW